MPKVSTRIEGFEEAKEALAALPKATGRASIRRVMKLALQPVMARAIALAPKDSGALREGYEIGTRLSRRQRKRNRKQSEVEMYLGNSDPAAIQTEFGNEHQSAQPHLRPAWRGMRELTLERVRGLLAIDLEKTMARFVRRQQKRGRQ